MKKVLEPLVWCVALFLVISASFGGFSTYDYSLRCTRCLREYQLVEHRFLGITFSRKEKLIFQGYDLGDFADISHDHIYRKGGVGEEGYYLLGMMMKDGMTAEGSLFKARFQVLKDAFELYKNFPNKELMRETMSFADECLPPDATLDFLHNPRYKKTAFLSILQSSLDRAKSEQDWKTALDDAKDLMATASN
jgi:hypothetical protein